MKTFDLNIKRLVTVQLELMLDFNFVNEPHK